MGPRSSKTPLRILCLGDSLTAGYPPAHPYAGKLVEYLEAAFPTHGVEIQVDGVPGDLVTRGSFIKRMETMWKMQEPEGGFDWTIVLGGTNDVGWGFSADKVLQSLKKVYDIPLSKGGKVLALTVPETRLENNDLDERRNAVNDGIKSHKQQNFYTFDLYKSVPYRTMSKADQEKYWDPDGLHFTEAGYDLIGEKVAEGLTKILHLEEAQSTEISSIVSDARQRKLIEELMFEEEQGNPKLLSQGWIVVRKRDLD
ncbi:putative SGNH hydrolase-type esterase domain-containing protein [Seiridium cardinale]